MDGPASALAANARAASTARIPVFQLFIGYTPMTAFGSLRRRALAIVGLQATPGRVTRGNDLLENDLPVDLMSVALGNVEGVRSRAGERPALAVTRGDVRQLRAARGLELALEAARVVRGVEHEAEVGHRAAQVQPAVVERRGRRRVRRIDAVVERG